MKKFMLALVLMFSSFSLSFAQKRGKKVAEVKPTQAKTYGLAKVDAQVLQMMSNWMEAASDDRPWGLINTSMPRHQKVIFWTNGGNSVKVALFRDTTQGAYAILRWSAYDSRQLEVDRGRADSLDKDALMEAAFVAVMRESYREVGTVQDTFLSPRGFVTIDLQSGAIFITKVDTLGTHAGFSPQASRTSADFVSMRLMEDFVDWFDVLTALRYVQLSHSPRYAEYIFPEVLWKYMSDLQHVAGASNPRIPAVKYDGNGKVTKGGKLWVKRGRWGALSMSWTDNSGNGPIWDPRRGVFWVESGANYSQAVSTIYNWQMSKMVKEVKDAVFAGDTVYFGRDIYASKDYLAAGGTTFPGKRLMPIKGATITETMQAFSDLHEIRWSTFHDSIQLFTSLRQQRLMNELPDHVDGYNATLANTFGKEGSKVVSGHLAYTKNYQLKVNGKRYRDVTNIQGTKAQRKLLEDLGIPNATKVGLSKTNGKFAYTIWYDDGHSMYLCPVKKGMRKFQIPQPWDKWMVSIHDPNGRKLGPRETLDAMASMYLSRYQ